MEVNLIRINELMNELVDVVYQGRDKYNNLEILGAIAGMAVIAGTILGHPKEKFVGLMEGLWEDMVEGKG